MELLTVFRKMDILFFGAFHLQMIPTGALRFAPPQKPELFQRSIIDAFTFRSIPMQHFTDPDGLYQKEFYDNPDFIFRFLKTVCI